MPKTMFDFEFNRLNFSNMLKPKTDYEVDFSIAFTYSLDMEALLGVPLSLGFLDDFDSSLKDNPIALLESIRRSKDKFAIFVNPGSIYVPDTKYNVYALLEDSVFSVKMQRGDKNFHPKLWLVNYKNLETSESYLKLIVMTRNLTFDRSFDYAIELVAKPGNSLNKKHLPLYKLIIEIAQSADCKIKYNKIFDLANILLNSEPFEDSSGFINDYDFFSFGLTEKNLSLLSPKIRYDDLIIISPFLTNNIVDKLSIKAKRKTLITRKSEIDKSVFDFFYNPETNKNDIFIVKEAFLESDEEDEKEMYLDIHAKIYYTYNWKESNLYIGSLNATHNAFNRNYEFMIKLKLNRRRIPHKYEDILKELITNKHSPFECLTEIDEENPSNEANQMQTDLKDLRQAIQLVKERGNSVIISEGSYGISLNFKKHNITDIFISPLLKELENKKIESKVIFTNLQASELSQFFIISKNEQKKVIKIKLNNIPKERDDLIIKSIIKDKNHFYKYIELLLLDGHTEVGIDFMRNDSTNNKTSSSNNIEALYEKMLRTAYLNPEKLKTIDDIIESLDYEIVTDEFRNMYKVFKEVVKGL